jgi:mono/diheme cytochrome c family protein
MASLIAAGPAANPEHRGRAVYLEECASCHGLQGDGQGQTAAMLDPRPRNFTTGVYKFRSTPSGQLPTDDDLLRTIIVGVPGTSMDGYAAMPEADRRALVAYLKSLSPRFSHEPPGEPLIMPPGPTPNSAIRTRGQAVYTRMQCAVCHGPNGRGDGPLADGLSDEEGRTIRPSDLTKPRRKSGHGPEAVYRTVMTGLDGTPMPSYGDSLAPEEAWDLAVYIQSLMQEVVK